jgi:transposase-like protein
MSDQELRSLRRQLAAHARGRGKRYAPDLRSRVTTWTQRAIADGARLASVARVLDIDDETLRKWLRKGSATSTALVPVEVVAEEPPGRTGVRVVSPAGYQVEGLGLGEVVALLRVLG